ncbi:MAG: RNA 2',3'-cyclic phosphodiesterase [Methanoregulaceae archaeon]|nr:RNA 2',3'-cyclic phosphodiesterase [Methanoregulaceae archaeon]
MVRAFIAVDLTPELKEAIRFCQEILSQSQAKLTFVNPSIVHITVKFLGEVRDSDIGPISSALQGISLPPFDISLTHIAGNARDRPRVIWAAVEDEGRCTELHARVEDALAPLRIPRDDRPFRPHATLARVRSFHPSLLAQIRATPKGPLGSCRVGGFSLRKSTLTPGGPIYEDITRISW